MRRVLVVTIVVGSIATVPAFALRNASAPPPGATAKCRDGTYSFSLHHSGTCSYHGGVAMWLDGSTSSSSSTSSVGSSCGVERWTVKTLQDRPRLLAAKTTTIHFLVTRPAPGSLPTTRMPFERHVYTLTANVVLVRKEADQDYHLVLTTPNGEHMIAESPAGVCDTKATALRKRQMTEARAKVQVCAKARVTGVAFFDFNHGQTGVAPNAIELHPILAFRCLTT